MPQAKEFQFLWVLVTSDGRWTSGLVHCAEGAKLEAKGFALPVDLCHRGPYGHEPQEPTGTGILTPVIVVVLVEPNIF